MPPEQPSAERVGKYRILGVLGRGGMGVVYKGLDPDIEREVAIKTVRADGFADGPAREEQLARVGREAKAAGRLNHPNIITIYDVIREDDQTYIVMQFVDGQTLQGLIESGRTFSPRDVVGLLKPVAEALDYAHAGGIVHRDVKPANILIDRDGKPFLADFGVARMETSTVTGPGTAIGTLSYMSPEQVMGKAVDGRADFFALGVILYELLAGRKPFAGDNLSTIVYKIVHEEPPSLAEANRDLPCGYEAVIRRALAKDPDARYQNGREMVADLEDPDNLMAAVRDYEQRTATMAGPRPTGAGRKRRLVLAAVPAAVAALVVGIILLRPRPETDPGAQAARITAAAAQPAQAVVPPPAEPAPPGPDLATLRASFERRDYAGTVRLAESVLAADPGQAEARELRIKAKAALDSELVGSRLESGKAAYASGRFADCVRDMEEVLRLDEANAEARDFLYKADTSLSRRDILALIERRCRAEERKDLAGVLQPLGTDGLVSLERGYFSMMFTIYDRIISEIGEGTVAVEFQDRARATASFHHSIRGLSRKDGSQKLILFSPERWTLEKRGDAWKVVRMQERS